MTVLEFMRRIRAGRILGLVEAMTMLHQNPQFTKSSVLVPEKTKKKMSTLLNEVLETCKALGLNASSATIRRLKNELSKSGVTWKEFGREAHELPGRLRDELSAISVVAMTAAETEHYNHYDKGWEEIIARFPPTINDIAESRKCFALGRYPGAVFHSLHIVEAGLLELGSFLNVADPRSGWTAVSAALDRVIQKKHPERTDFEKRHFEFLEQTQGTVAALKNAWRNKVSHAQGTLVLLSTDFSQEIAEEILIATRAFMRRLSEGLPAPKPPEKLG